MPMPTLLVPPSTKKVSEMLAVIPEVSDISNLASGVVSPMPILTSSLGSVAVFTRVNTWTFVPPEFSTKNRMALPVPFKAASLETANTRLAVELKPDPLPPPATIEKESESIFAPAAIYPESVVA